MRKVKTKTRTKSILNSLKKSKNKTKTRKNHSKNYSNIYIHSQSRIYKENNGKVIENVLTERNNNKIYIKGIINGKKINKKLNISP